MTKKCTRSINGLIEDQKKPFLFLQIPEASYIIAIFCMFYIQIYISFRLVLLLKWWMSLIHDHATLNNFHISNYGHQILTKGEPLGESSIALSAIFTTDVIIVRSSNFHKSSYFQLWTGYDHQFWSAGVTQTGKSSKEF